MSEPLTRYPADQGIQAGWEDAEFYLCSEVDELLARRAPPADLLRGLRDFVADSGISLHPPGCDCCHHQLLARADAYLEGREHPGGRHHPGGREPQNYSAAQMREAFMACWDWAGNQYHGWKIREEAEQEAARLYPDPEPPKEDGR